MRNLIFKLFVFVLSCFSFSQVAYSSIEYRYFYDELGQLIKATDSTGTIIEYVYDEVGNHVAVKRTDGSGFAILSVSPASGAVGSEVVIEGRGFSAIASEDKVTFDGIPATAVSASSTQLVVIVPDGISTGVIAVSVGGKTITADNNFHSAAVPVISSVSHQYALSGTTISGFAVTGNHLTGAAFSFTPAITPPAASISAVTIADDGKSAVFSVNVSSSAIGTFVLQATNADGQSDAFGSAANTLTVLGSASSDSDGDGLTNEEEIARGTNPTSSDSDNDGLPDKYELDNGLDPNNPLDAFLDSDKDGFDNLTEFERGTNPQNSDITPPAVAQTIPAKAEVNFATNGKIVVRFTEPLQPASVLPGSVRLFQDSLAIIGDVVLSSDQLSITFDPKDSLSAFTDYKVQVQSVRDLAGNPMVDTFESTFTTGEFIDDIRPTLITTSIIDAAKEVPVNTPYTVLFSEAMNPSSLTDKTFVIHDNTTSRDVKGMIQVDPSGTAASFVPENPFAVGRSFTVILNTAITDISGNLLDRNYFFSFTTAFDEDNTPPTVTQISPADGISGVPANANVMVEFSDPLDRINIASAITLQADGANIPGSIALSNGNRRATFTPATNLAPNTLIAVNIDGKTKDIAGNVLGTAVSSQFTTGSSADIVRPGIVSVAPFNGEKNVPVNVVIQVEVNERINPLTVTESGFYLYDTITGRHVSGGRSVSTDGQTLTLVPDELLKAGRTYYVYAPDIRDLANNSFGGGFIGQFSTAP
ncbi:MAG: hypothetical protein DU480_08605 [Nitrosomonas sp.]|uniref:Ig-like domain-containing protein n=1 Tax=Nitrosomonas sp. TaxID=42353 RepID=UPI0032EBF584